VTYHVLAVSPRPPTLPQRNMDLHVWDVVILAHSRSHRNQFTSLAVRGVKVFHFPIPITLAITVEAVVTASVFAVHSSNQ